MASRRKLLRFVPREQVKCGYHDLNSKAAYGALRPGLMSLLGRSYEMTEREGSNRIFLEVDILVAENKCQCVQVNARQRCVCCAMGKC